MPRAAELGTFLTDLESGKKKSEALKDALKGVLDSFQHFAINKLTASLFGENGKPGGGLFGDFVGGALKLFPFADGGMITMAHLPSYAVGGALAPGGGFPILAHPGEIILNQAQQQNVASGMQPKVTINNNAAGVQVTPEVTRDEMIFHIDSRIAANNQRLPGIMSGQNARQF